MPPTPWPGSTGSPTTAWSSTSSCKARDGLDVLDEALARYPDMRCVVTAGFGSVEQAVRALKRGAVDFLIKPFQLIQLVQVMKTSVSERRLQRENAELRGRLNEKFKFGSLVGSSPLMKRLFATLELVSPMNSTVLLQGETGTGKELVARTIHHNSPRARSAVRRVQRRGHSGRAGGSRAVRPRQGRLHRRDRQPRPAVSKRPTRARSSSTRSRRCRWRCRPSCCGRSRSARSSASARRSPSRSTPGSSPPRTRTCRSWCARARFREDLFYRLNVVRLTLPPLRDRKEDIPVLAQHFVQRACADNGLPTKTLSQGALRLLMHFAWPGNIRHLQNAAEHAVAMSGEATEIAPDHLPDDIHSPVTGRRAGAAADAGRGHQLRDDDEPRRARADPAVSHEGQRQQAPGRAPAQPQPHDAHRQAASPRIDRHFRPRSRALRDVGPRSCLQRAARARTLTTLGHVFWAGCRTLLVVSLHATDTDAACR